MNRWLRRCNQRFQFTAPLLKWFAAQVAVSMAEQIEEHDRSRRFARKQLHPRCSRMQSQLQRVKVERISFYDNDLAIEHAAGRQRCAQRVFQLRKISVQRL